MYTMKRIISLFVILLMTIMLFESCDKTTETEDEAPVIPPQSSMVMNFSDFPDTTNPSILPKGENVNTYNNWGWAALNIAVWNSVLTLTLAIPVAAFGESFNHDPVLQEDGSWLWSYTVEVGGISHTAKLYGKIESSDSIVWRMLITKQNTYTDFEWFTGISNLPATEGTWTLYKDPANPVEFLSIEWHRDTQNETADIKYINITPGVPENGSFIFYGKTTVATYDRFYNLFGAETNNTINIEWNFDAHFGRVKDPVHFSDSNWQCWDELLMDTLCE